MILETVLSFYISDKNGQITEYHSVNNIPSARTTRSTMYFSDHQLPNERKQLPYGPIENAAFIYNFPFQSKNELYMLCLSVVTEILRGKLVIENDVGFSYFKLLRKLLQKRCTEVVYIADKKNINWQVARGIKATKNCIEFARTGGILKYPIEGDVVVSVEPLLRLSQGQTSI